MTALALTARHGLGESARYARAVGPWKVALVVALVALASSDAGAGARIVTALSDAFLQVSVFVAATMALVFAAEKVFGLDLMGLLARHPRWQVPVAALMGALPGCGGAIMVVTQFTLGHITFGAVVATLTATMGDAAFLLLAREPLTGLGVFALGLVVGVGSGLLVDAVHGPGFLRMPGRTAAAPPCHGAGAVPRPLRRLWLSLAAVGLVVGAALLAQVDVDSALRELMAPLLADAAEVRPTVWLGTTGALLALFLWGGLPGPGEQEDGPRPACPAEAAGGPQGGGGVGLGGGLDHVIADTNFVTAWVVLAYLAYELGIYYTGVDLKALFEVWAPFVPLVGVLVGFLPGCGPQIVVTTLYLSGIIPLSAQLGNALSNDGDALFPAIALAPRAAAVATLYSAVPALVIAYGYFLLEV